MPVCEQEFVGSTLRMTRVNFLGARGIEAVVAVDHTRGNAVALRWLLYDGHGNLVRMLSPDYRLSAFQWRGVWSEVQGSLGAGRGYCANLGHPEDETGLVYMRARYYEPATGRFISEDPARDGVNWYLYADGNPITNNDFTGLSSGTYIDQVMAEGEVAALAWSESSGMTAALGIKGRAVELAAFLMSQYAALARLVEAGYAKGGVFAWRFIDALGRYHLYRFDVGRNLLIHNGPAAGGPHHQKLTEFIRMLLETLGETLG
jgi:RHS repeat-associated protein